MLIWHLLLIPNYETPQIHSVAANGLELNISGKPDPRLNRKLTIQEFIKAFGKFKRVMSSVYPDRRAELDAYEDEIIDISNFYGDRFYDYHKLFSAKSAALLRERRIKVDWSKRDRDLLSLIVAGGNVNVCKICNLVDHTTAFCPMQTSMTYQDYPDKVSRQVDTTDKLEKGFDTMVSTTDLPTKECRNSLSARTQPDVVSDLIEKEVFKGFLYGPFKDPPFQNYRVSPIGIAEGKYSGKKRLILDLSSPHNDDKHLSINDLIDKQDCSMSYVRIDDAIDVILKFGRNSWLCKFDISDAFKNCPIVPSQWPLFCIKWEKMYYFYVRLTFGCRSSPKIFDHLSQALCHIAENNYKVNSILHLLDDFLTIDPPDADGERTMAI
ncbi:Hypothetical predicted protein [Mytilus galloprovincialis]|uniref:Reverse transcriptase domain-containing protein n=1 Tax=Mytilus galloprovincialis TaxID=29158 RepID=A0A8B6CYU2_MYTGA|nr:Hypothetical predicted protein [Mytilus galloprovincialis]